jgi:hypothetical protein
MEKNSFVSKMFQLFEKRNRRVLQSAKCPVLLSKALRFPIILGGNLIFSLATKLCNRVFLQPAVFLEFVDEPYRLGQRLLQTEVG